MFSQEITQNLSFRPLLTSTKSKKVCFFKSGDPQFSGHWVIINSRTFRTFDALLDALSNKVPLPFGVRTIKTPKGTHTIRSLDDLQHGGIYVCSDRRKFKPLNLDEINQRHVPWNSARPTSAGRQGRRGQIRQLAKKNDQGRITKITVRTPKKFVVFKNGDPSTKRIMIFQRRTAPTFEALLECLSQVMQFSVVKVYTADGKRVEGLPVLILCTGVIVAAGNEPFQQANYNLQASSSHSLPSHSVISESTAPITTQSVPNDEVEKSFCVNQDGSMTMEMKVRLTIKQEEMIHWTTTLSRACVNSQESYNSLAKKNIDNNITKVLNIDRCECKNDHTNSYKPMKLNNDREHYCEFAASEALENPKPCYRRLPTPGPRLVRRKKPSVKNMKCQSQSKVHETRVDAYSLLENTPKGELSEVDSVVSPSGSCSIQPVQKLRRDNLGATKYNKTHSSLSGMSDVLQLHCKEKEITENHSQVSGESLTRPWAEENSVKCMFKELRNPNATEEEPRFLSNDCKKNLSKFPVSSGSGQSEPSQAKTTFTLYENQTRCEFSDTRVKKSTNEASENKRVPSKTKMAQKSERPSKNITDKKQNAISPNFLKKKKGQSPKNRKTNHSKVLMDQSNIQLRHNEMPKPQMENEINVIPSFYSSPSKILKKQNSVNDSKTKSCNVHQYVENWLEINHPESVPYMDELNLYESRARFQIESEFSDISEFRSEPENYNLDRKALSQQLVQISGEGQSAKKHNLGRFSKSLPSVRIHTYKQEICRRMNNSLEDLVPKWPDSGSETSSNTQLNPSSGKKQVLEQLCLPAKCSRRASIHSCQSSLKLKKKSSSLPDFSLHLASVFGLSSKTLLSLLIMMTLRDETGVLTNSHNSDSNPETLQVINFIQKLSRIKDEEELKASLVSLHNSLSAKLKKNWRDFQEKTHIKENPPMSPKMLEQDFALEINSEKGKQNKGDPFYFKEVMKELNLCDKISLPVRDNLTNSDQSNSTMQHPGHKEQINNSALENKVIIKDDVAGLFEEKRTYSDETTNNDFTNVMPAKLCQKTTNQKGLVEIVDDVIINQEMYLNKELSKADFSEDKQLMDNVQLVDEKYKKHQISLVDEIYVPDYYPSNLENKMECKKYAGCLQFESELPITISETTNAEENNDNVSETEDYPDSFERCAIQLKKEYNDCETTNHAEKPDAILVDSETESDKAHCPTNGTIKTEKKDALNKIARSEASNLSADETDPYIDNDNDRMEVESNTDNEKTIGSTSECEKSDAIPHHYSMTDQMVEQSKNYRGACWTQQEHKFEKSEEESVIRRNGYNTNKKEIDKDEDFNSNQTKSLYLHQKCEYSYNSESSDSQEAFAKLYLQPLNEGNLSKSFANHAEQKENKAHKLDIKLTKASATDYQSHHSCLEKPSITDSLVRESGKSEDKHQTHSEDYAKKEKADMDHKYHCGHPALLPQQLLDFVNLALMSSALIFTYDSNGFLRLEPDNCKSRVMSISKSSVENHYSRCLPSPNTSDLSDYRPDTSDSGESLSQFSTDLFTESEEDVADKMFIYQGNIKCSTKHYPDAKQKASPVHCDFLGYFGNTEHAQCLTFQTKNESEEGILIDKGRWLLKENHLIRKSPPVPMGMYDNVDTTSVDTSHISDDASCIPCGTQQSEMALISSSELEDMTKPSTPKCSYFNMVHSSDSDPFLDNQSNSSNKGRGFSQKRKEVSPLGEPARICVKKNGSLPSFSSVEFKLAAAKVHPTDGPVSNVVEKPIRSQSLRCNPPHEEELVEGLSLRCGQYCLIL
ncbi:Oxygen-regulated protein 1 [Bagarius yarrelli]|uniref:Oxygen-regulated protein 1 n=1 Tax=Bagarius yarrelli TaxID=175774 RepID=A0A556TV97_BAGYA|nr:Oxygen-regulated protein 1 [Bagarius yarrelli]